MVERRMAVAFAAFLIVAPVSEISAATLSFDAAMRHMQTPDRQIAITGPVTGAAVSAVMAADQYSLTVSLNAAELAAGSAEDLRLDKFRAKANRIDAHLPLPPAVTLLAAGLGLLSIASARRNFARRSAGS